MSLTVAVLRETAEGEKRVALDPGSASKLEKRGIRVLVEKDAGKRAGFNNDQYGGAAILDDRDALLTMADVVMWVQPPDVSTVNHMNEGSVGIGHAFAHRNPDLVNALNDQKISCLAMELVPRITRAQSMDVLSSQATVAGYKAVLRAASLAPRLFPMLTTAAGTLRPSRVIVIGAGVAGLQAIATARRLGARVEAYDIRSAAREQVESLGAKMIDTGVDAEGEGGYARELTDEEKQQQAEKLAEHLAKSDVVISTAAIPGRPAPKIITTAMVDDMQPGTVIVDLAAESGGNCELTQPGTTIDHDGVIIDGPLNLASQAAIHASEMYARNLVNLMDLMIEEDSLKVDMEDEVIAGTMLTHQGKLVHEQTAKLLGLSEGDN
ncbi:MAG: NAD(P) transhydrogenase subunit alpha [Xanthomonadales bacterium]|nr:NAD(P) transhydrogenase subunit alpha [Xanthomonadales bacterium]NNL96077.1 NAD(P) transhydrogenase subunit alpha [Xanthomonadales bacterium]